MKLYLYNKETKELLGSAEAHIDPLESIKAGHEIFVIPPFSTPFPPLEAKKGKVNVFNEAKGVWELVEDNRGLEIFDKDGNSKVISELGEIPEGYSKTKKYNIQEEKLKLVEQVNAKYSDAQREAVEVGSVVDNIDARRKLEELKEFIGDNEFGTFNSSNGTPVILNKAEVEYLSKYFYVRSLLLPLRRNEIIKDIRKAKTKEALGKIKIDFDILKETEKLASKSDDALSEYIRKKLK